MRIYFINKKRGYVNKKINQVSGLSAGEHTIRVLGISTVEGGTMPDAVTVG